MRGDGVSSYLMANAELSKFSRNYMQLKKSLPIRPSEMGVLNIIVQTSGPPHARDAGRHAWCV